MENFKKQTEAIREKQEQLSSLLYKASKLAQEIGYDWSDVESEMHIEICEATKETRLTVAMVNDCMRASKAKIKFDRIRQEIECARFEI